MSTVRAIEQFMYLNTSIINKEEYARLFCVPEIGRENDSPRSIAIIGGGATGVSVLTQLITQFESVSTQIRLKIYLIETTSKIGPGLAYSTDNKHHILNMSAETMGIYPEKSGDFVEWLKESKSYFSDHSEAINSQYLPRLLYGKYLENRFQLALDRAKKNEISVELVNDEAIAVKTDHNRVLLDLRNGRRIDADYLVLALGNLPPTVGQEMISKPGYVHCQWHNKDKLDRIPSREPVAILGSGLSAVDAVLSLITNGHKGKITLVSRNGWLPKVRSVPRLYERKLLTLRTLRLITKGGRLPLSLKHVEWLFQKEIELAEGRKIDWEAVFDLTETGKVLKNDLLSARGNVLAWQNVLISTETIINDIWNMMSLGDQALFDKKYSTLWSVFRHPMPVKNAEKILGYLEGGQLEVRGGLQKFAFKEDGDRFVFEFAESLLEASYLINTSGHGSQITKIQSQFIQNALNQGVITPQVFGGLNIDYHSNNVINGNNEILSHVYAVGSLTKGVRFYTNSIDQNASCAKEIARSILENIEREEILSAVQR
jgi:uncharacterized NAD(P)/FAD-binding protein YdhS